MAEMDEIMTDDALSREEIIERMKKCRSMIGNMCSEGRPPKMQIPAKHDEYNEDIYICDTLRAAEKLLDTPPKPAAMRSATDWYDKVGDCFTEDRVNLAPGELSVHRETLLEVIAEIQNDALASAKLDGVAWRKIETLPADYNEMIIYCDIRDGKNRVGVAYRAKDGFYRDSESEWHKQLSPDLWMPLPRLP